jgi:beta-glucosidase/6-phospho-beta-glucosidase/beta-galactosidase
MLTLFHHSLPEWAIKMGGWTNPDLIDYFNGFAMDALKYFHDDIHFLITFNEPNVYSMFSYVTGMWPPGASNKWALINPLSGDFYTAQQNMAKAHNLLYQKIRPKQYDIKVSVAHNIANYKASKWYHKLNVWWANKYMNYYFLDLVRSNLDFLGFNYYGAEIIDFKGPVFKEGIQYSDAGRAVDAKGLLSQIESLYFRYSLPLFITENGVADSRDHLREYYLLKHLGRIEEAISKDIPILGYIHWTLTDNFEWSDGYCPKFGLVAVDRKNDLKRIKRDSFYFYQRIISKKSINPSEILKDYLANDGKLRDMCRSSNGVDALDRAKTQAFKAIL